MNRYGLFLRQRTKIAQKLPADLETKIKSFHKFVIKMRRLHGYDLNQIGNMNEMLMTFDLLGNRTVHPSGAKTVLIKMTGHENMHFTVVLACMVDGTKLKPTVIFKRKMLPKGAKFPAGVLICSHVKGWMDEDGTKEWLHKVWNKRPGALLKQRSLLVWDMFRMHVMDSMKRSSR